MPNRRYLIALLALLACLVATTATAGGLKDRMIQRKPAIDAMLAKGVIGENNVGMLTVRGSADKGVVSAENADRAKVYAAIAKKTGTTPAVVGQRRAAKIAQQAPPGTWLQQPGGQWYKK
ncbi:DUF1318 domain-containing protein [Pseudodesulfovibrio cashew]|uniref:DUF1318 domain-containing protein n=1 Tax=Pseudodesulfovibrio cashew TaxID=2678688 RepID=A0A6I6JCT9_9BACT|nr:YdbL family protein [Pseudodesulfovibrio cashew]QGY38959.1 DUF1318 domain-containing protein [Pseudodesulfovibrio cashew]